MDKTLEIIMVAVALLVATVIVVSILQGRSSDIGDAVDEQTKSTACNIGLQNYKSTCDCSLEAPQTAAGKNIKTKYRNRGCSWAQRTDPGVACSELCPLS